MNASKISIFRIVTILSIFAATQAQANENDFQIINQVGKELQVLAELNDFNPVKVSVTNEKWEKFRGGFESGVVNLEVETLVEIPHCEISKLTGLGSSIAYGTETEPAKLKVYGAGPKKTSGGCNEVAMYKQSKITVPINMFSEGGKDAQYDFQVGSVMVFITRKSDKPAEVKICDSYDTTKCM